MLFLLAFMTCIANAFAAEPVKLSSPDGKLELSFELKSSLTEYYKVSSLEDYDQVYRAVAFFSFKYGRIDFLESNNEYWLEQDAHLRTDFNIPGGFRVEDVPRIKYKSSMKEYYRQAGIPTARFHMVGDAEGCRAFIKEVGWPVIVKPDNGVGSNATYKLKNEEDLSAFLAERDGRFRALIGQGRQARAFTAGKNHG